GLKGTVDQSASLTKAPRETQYQGPSQTPGETPTQAPSQTPEAPVTQAPTQTPVPEKTNEERVWELIDRIEALSFGDITLESREEIQGIRREYDALPEEYQEMVMNYPLFLNMEKVFRELENPNDILTSEEGKDGSGLSDGHGIEAIDGTPLFYTDMISNLHAGKEFYLNSLKESYQLSFSQDFSQVMEEIEEEYLEKCGLASEEGAEHLVRNWQDVLAVYIYQQSLEGKESYVLDPSCKEDLAAIFEELNPLVEDEPGSGRMTFANDHINAYIKKHGIEREDRTVLKKYTETDCKLLCAVVTGAKGFVRQSVGEDVSEDRVNVIAAAYSILGEVGYFWGGKSVSIGKDPAWGSVMPVTAEGSRSTGTLRAYGLDCSGFVTWAVINGYGDTAMGGRVGNGTTDQWMRANVVSEADAQPGDLVFQRGPEAGYDNHVGILCGKTDAGDWIAVHCSSSQNGVTVGEAYSAGFRYIRQPSFYQGGEDLLLQTQEQSQAASSVWVDNALLDLFRSGDLTAAEERTEGGAGMDDGAIAGRRETGVPSGVWVDNALSGLFTGGQEREEAPQQGPALVEETVRIAPSSVTVDNAIADLLSGTDLLSQGAEPAAAVSWQEPSPGRETARIAPSEVTVHSGISELVFAQGEVFSDSGEEKRTREEGEGGARFTSGITVNNALSELMGAADAGDDAFADQ
ncbi:MAG: NlpC/P60 family protein, partial [Eubacteriales bacterium]|nr:NlpC/P60 family protein [Eubacteriales bacterium]